MHVLEVENLIRNYQKSALKKSDEDIKVLKGLNFSVRGHHGKVRVRQDHPFKGAGNDRQADRRRCAVYG